MARVLRELPARGVRVRQPLRMVPSGREQTRERERGFTSGLRPRFSEEGERKWYEEL